MVGQVTTHASLLLRLRDGAGTAAWNEFHERYGGLIRGFARRRGLQVGTIDAILAQLCIRYELRLLTTDADFARIAEHEPLERWTP